MGNEYTPQANPLEIFGSAARFPSPYIHITDCPLTFDVGNIGYSMAAGTESSYTSVFDTALMPIAVYFIKDVATTGDVKADLVQEGSHNTVAWDEEKRWALSAGDTFFVYLCKARYQRWKFSNLQGGAGLTVTFQWYLRSAPYGV